MTRPRTRYRPRSLLKGPHKRLRANAAISRWKWPVFLGLGSLFFLVLSRTASAKPSPFTNNILPGPAGGNVPIQSGTDTIPELPATMAPTQSQVATAHTFWDTLTPVQSLDSGFINFPTGSQAAATLFDTRMNPADGTYYVQWAGLTYQLGNQDSSGNWPAMVIG